MFVDCCQLMLARFALIIFDAGKSPYESVHSVTIEPTQLNSVGTKTAYQATGGLRNRLAQIQVTSAAVVCGVISAGWRYSAGTIG